MGSLNVTRRCGQEQILGPGKPLRPNRS